MGLGIRARRRYSRVKHFYSSMRMRPIITTSLVIITLLAAGCASQSTAGSVPAAAAAGSQGYDSARARDNRDQADKSAPETDDSAQ